RALLQRPKGPGVRGWAEFALSGSYRVQLEIQLLRDVHENIGGKRPPPGTCSPFSAGGGLECVDRFEARCRIGEGRHVDRLSNACMVRVDVSPPMGVDDVRLELLNLSLEGLHQLQVAAPIQAISADPLRQGG